MNTQRGGSKKRKGESLEAEKSLYSTFTAAANSVSQLYTAAVQQTKRAEEQGARQALVSGGGLRWGAGGRLCPSPCLSALGLCPCRARHGLARRSPPPEPRFTLALHLKSPCLQERVAQFVVKEYGNAPAVPTGVLMEVLRQELQVGGRVAFLTGGHFSLAAACKH